MKSRPRGLKQDIAKTIRGAVETYDSFVSTLVAFITTPGLTENKKSTLPKYVILGDTGVTFFRAEILVLRAFVQVPVLARRETEFCTKKW